MTPLRHLMRRNDLATLIFEFCNAIPVITDAKADDWRGGSGPKATDVHRSETGAYLLH